MSIFRTGLMSFLLIALQSTLVNYLALGGIAPDLLLIWVVIIALREGQLKGTIWGFAIGLVADLVSGGFLGLSALTKTIGGFIAGYFYNENKTRQTLGSYRLLAIMLFVGLVHNILYFIIFTRGAEISIADAVLRFGLISTLYTTTVTILPLLAFSRKQPLVR